MNLGALAAKLSSWFSVLFTKSVIFVLVNHHVDYHFNLAQRLYCLLGGLFEFFVHDYSLVLSYKMDMCMDSCKFLLHHSFWL